MTKRKLGRLYFFSIIPDLIEIDVISITHYAGCSYIDIKSADQSQTIKYSECNYRNQQRTSNRYYKLLQKAIKKLKAHMLNKDRWSSKDGEDE